MVIRAATGDDLGQVLRMYEWLFDPPGAPPPNWDLAAARARLGAVIDAPGAECWVAAEGERLYGFCVVHLDIASVRYGQRAWVEDLAVDPERRSQGIGKKLLDQAKRWGRERGATHLELDSALTRAHAHRFYDREEPSWKSICFGWEL